MRSEPLRLGILGLGTNWRRWRRVLRNHRYCRVEVVFDQVLQTAWQEAARQGCRAAESVWQLVSWPGLDAVLFCDEQWFGLWPLEFALTCVPASATAPPSGSARETPGAAAAGLDQMRYWWSLVAPTVDLVRAPALLERIAARHWPVFFVWPEWHVPAAQRLCRQAQGQLGTISWMEVETVTAAHQHTCKSAAISPTVARAYRFWSGALLWLSELTDAIAQEAHRLGSLQDGQTHYHTLLVRFPENRWARLDTVVLANGEEWPKSSFRGTNLPPHPHPGRLHVRLMGTRGEALFRWPDTLDWYFRKHHVRERWPVAPTLEYRLLRVWRKQWLEGRVPTKHTLSLKHYCELLLASGQS